MIHSSIAMLREFYIAVKVNHEIRNNVIAPMKKAGRKRPAERKNKIYINQKGLDQ